MVISNNKKMTEKPLNQQVSRAEISNHNGKTRGRIVNSDVIISFKE